MEQVPDWSNEVREVDIFDFFIVVECFVDDDDDYVENDVYNAGLACLFMLTEILFEVLN